MRLVLAVSVLCACGGAPAVAVENRGGTASASCDLPARLEFEARRYGNVDADHADYQTWSAWRVGMQLRAQSHVEGARLARAGSRGSTARVKLAGTLAMVGDELVWNFEITGELDTERCVVEVVANTHEPLRATVDVRAHTGTIKSIDDAWLLGPPFPEQRP